MTRSGNWGRSGHTPAHAAFIVETVSPLTRAVAAVGIVALSVLGVAVALPAVTAEAAAGDLVFGVVRADANANNSIDMPGVDGLDDLPVAGVTVRLIDVNEGAIPGAEVVTDATGAYSFPLAGIDTVTYDGPYRVEVDTGAPADAIYATHTATSADNDFARGTGTTIAFADVPTDPVPAEGFEFDALIYPVWITQLDLAVHEADGTPGEDGYDPGGVDGLSVYTGTAPFDTLADNWTVTGDDPEDEADNPWDPETEAGADTGQTNYRVRTADTVSYNWALSLQSPESLGNSTANVVFEQTIYPVDGAVINFAQIPSELEICTGTGSPANSIIAYDSAGNSLGEIEPRVDPPADTAWITLTCNLGEMGTGSGLDQGRTIPTTVFVSASSSNGASFTTDARSYAVDDNGTATAQPDGPVEHGPIEITATPRYDLAKWGWWGGYKTTRRIDGEVVAGSLYYTGITISTDRQSGVEALQQPITFTDHMWAEYTANTDVAGASQGDVVPGFEWYVTQCYTSPYLGSGGYSYNLPGGRIGVGSNTAANSVSHSGTCDYERTDATSVTSDYEFTLDGIDMTGWSYPTTSLNGNQDFTAGPFYVAAYRVQIFVPDRSIEPTISGEYTGEASVFNLVKDFDPDAISGGGNTNYGTGVEPGYCADDAADGADCDAMVDDTRSNNVIGPSTMKIAGPGTWGKYNFWRMYAWDNDAADWTLPQESVNHAGNGILQPGQTAGIRVHISAVGQQITNPQMLDVWDNTTATLAPLSDLTSVGTTHDGTEFEYAIVSDGSLAATEAAQRPVAEQYTVYYAHVDLTADTPNDGVYDLNSGRYGGDWTLARTYVPVMGVDGTGATLPIHPNNDTTATWTTDPTAVTDGYTTGLEAVNAIWAVSDDGTTIDIGHNHQFKYALTQRDTYYNPAQAVGSDDSPVDGESIPAGTVVADFARINSDNYGAGWSGRSYRAQPETGNVDGDRWTVARATMQLQKRTVTAQTIDGDTVGTGVADYGETGTTVAGNQVVWEVNTAINSLSEDPAAVHNVTIVDTLPEYVTYNEQCTADLIGGTVATTVTENADGTTTLTWDLGTRVPNQAIPPRLICTDTDTLTPSNESLVNTAQIYADEIPPNTASHRDTHTVTVERGSSLSLKKTVDEKLDVEDQEQTYTLLAVNNSSNLPVNDPVLYDVLPYNGDATSADGILRDPGSDFEGTSSLTGAPTATFIGGAAISGTFYYVTEDTLATAGITAYDIPQDIASDTDPALWTTAVADWSTVLAFKFVSDDSIAIAGNADRNTMVIEFTTDQDGNDAGDVYENRFTIFSKTFSSCTTGSTDCDDADRVYQVLTSNQVGVRVVGFSLGDLVWFDEDGDGAYDSTVDTVAPAGVEIDVYSSEDDTTPVAIVYTDENGRWIVNSLAAGDYYAVIPATEFDEATDPLYHYVPVTPVQTFPNSDENEGVDHHAIADGAGGVRTSGVLTLNYLDDSEGNPVGQEPLGDNVGGLNAGGATDRFTNLTLDMALERPDVEFDVTKTVDGDGAAHAASTFTIQVVCTLDGSEVLNVTETFTDGQARTFSAPSGSECTVTETDDGGATSVTFTPDGGTVELDHQASTTSEVEVTNTYDEGSIQIAKAFTGPGSEFAAGQEFEFQVQCTFDGRLVYDDTVTLTAGSDDSTVYSDVIDGLPVGAECVVTETDEANADGAAAPVTVTVTEDGDDNVASVPVNIANFYSAGTVDILKTVDADPYGAFFSGLEYEVLVMCQMEDDDNNVLTLHSEYVTLIPGVAFTLQNADDEDALFPVGTHCFIHEESVDQGAGTVTLSHDSYANSVLVTTSDEDEPQTLELGVDNEFDMAELTVSKETIGDVPVDDQTGDPVEFAFQLQCTYPVTDDQGNVVDTVLPLATEDAAFTLASGEFRTITVPVGTSCVVTETDDQGALSTTIVDSDDTTADDAETGAADGALDELEGTDNTVVVTNEFPVTISVTKLVTGDAGDEWGTGPFTIVVRCWDPEGERIDMNPSLGGFREVLTITEDLVGIPQELDVQVPVGSTCRAIETVTGQATEVTYDPASNNGSRAVLTAEDGGDNAITVTNRFDDGALQLLKTLSGAGAEAFGAGDSFEFQVRCDFNGVEDAFSRDVTLTVPDDFDFSDPDAYIESEVFEGLPVGMECVVTETDHGAANEASQPVVVTITDEVTVVDAEFDNRYAAGHIALAKSIDAPTTQATTFFEGLTYSAQVTCQREVGDVLTTLHSAIYTVTPGVPVRPLLAGEPLLLPIGAKCFIGEVIGHGADDVEINFDSFENAVEVFASGTEDVQPLELALTNVWNDATLRVTKTTEGAAPNGGEFDFQVQCTYPVTDEEDGVVDEVFPLAAEDAAFTLKAGETREITVPEGVSCTVTEDTPADVLDVEVTDSDASSGGGSTDGVVTEISGTAQVAFVNVYKPRVYANTGAEGMGTMVGVTAGLLGFGALLLIGGARRRPTRPAGRHHSES